MEHVSDRVHNPFDLRPPFDGSEAGDEPAVFAYGEANADFHVIGDHPGVHGGTRTGVPFTGTRAGREIVALLRRVGLARGTACHFELENCIASYRHMCTLPAGREPTASEYATLERYFDAELRAINAHVLCPVGAGTTDHVLREYTTRRGRLELDMDRLHGRQVRGRGFMVVPVREPTTWTTTDRRRITDAIAAILSSDYRQTKGIATLVG